jgi:hypothetical protein
MNTNIDLFSLPVEERMKMIKQHNEDCKEDILKVVKLNVFLYALLAVIFGIVITVIMIGGKV